MHMVYRQFCYTMANMSAESPRMSDMGTLPPGAMVIDTMDLPDPELASCIVTRQVLVELGQRYQTAAA